MISVWLTLKLMPVWLKLSSGALLLLRLENPDIRVMRCGSVGVCEVNGTELALTESSSWSSAPPVCPLPCLERNPGYLPLQLARWQSPVRVSFSFSSSVLADTAWKPVFKAPKLQHDCLLTENQHVKGTRSWKKIFFNISWPLSHEITRFFSGISDYFF